MVKMNRKNYFRKQCRWKKVGSHSTRKGIKISYKWLDRTGKHALTDSSRASHTLPHLPRLHGIPLSPFSAMTVCWLIKGVNDPTIERKSNRVVVKGGIAWDKEDGGRVGRKGERDTKQDCVFLGRADKGHRHWLYGCGEELHACQGLNALLNRKTYN